MLNIYCGVGNAPDPDEPAEGGRSVGVDLLWGMPFPSLNLYKQKRMKLLFSSYSLHILGMAKTRRKEKKKEKRTLLFFVATALQSSWGLDSFSVTLAGCRYKKHLNKNRQSKVLR